MSYNIYAFNDYDINNMPEDEVSTISPSDFTIDPSSNASTLILRFNYDGAIVENVMEGSFTYNSRKQTGYDVLSNSTSIISTYLDNQLISREVLNPPQDAYAISFDPYAKRLQYFSGNDEFVGSITVPHSDVVRGYLGNDQFTGNGSGDWGDYFDGESGFDVAYLRGTVSQYTISSEMIFDRIKGGSAQIAGFKVTDSLEARDGVDYYVNVERLYFSDNVVALDINGNAGQSYRLYKAALDRVPDGPGLAGWIDYMDKGGQLPAMSQMFIDSPEFIAKYGPLDDAGFVNQLYLNVLDRNADAAGLAGWLDAMANGASRAHVLIGFSESNENQANVIGQIENGIVYTELV